MQKEGKKKKMLNVVAVVWIRVIRDPPALRRVLSTISTIHTSFCIKVPNIVVAFFAESAQNALLNPM